MKCMRSPLLALAIALAGAAHAATPAPAPAGPAASAAAKAEPASSTRVLEDDRVRIEETRIRGQVQRVTVRSKLTGQDYEIIVGPGGRDPSQKSDAAGQRAWSVFRF
jgi:hypothetical protein